MRQLHLELRADLPGGRRALRLRAGSLAVTVTEVPAASLTASEWRDILLARRSYAEVWGAGDDSVVVEDAFDGRREAASTWDVRHYLARVRDDRTTAMSKLVTARKVAVQPATLTAAQKAEPADVLPPDVRFWRVRTADGTVPLWNPLRAHLRRTAPDDDLAEFRFGTMGRFATYPHGDGRRDVTPLAWAAIQILAAFGDRSLLHLRTIRPDFADRVLAVRGRDGARAVPVFPPTEEALGLAPGSLEFDDHLAVVQQYREAVPGYFVDGHHAAAVLFSLLQSGDVAVGDLSGAVGRLIAGEPSIGGEARRLERMVAVRMTPDHSRLAELLTRPLWFKYLGPLLSGAEMLSRMSTETFRARLVHETRAVPFSSAATPATWSASAWKLVESRT